MGNERYPLELKLEVVSEYRRGVRGYKAIARERGLTRELVRSWVSNPRLSPRKENGMKRGAMEGEKDIEYYKLAAMYWETYARGVEALVAEDAAAKKKTAEGRVPPRDRGMRGEGRAGEAEAARDRGLPEVHVLQGAQDAREGQ